MNPFKERKNILDAIGKITRLTFSTDEKAADVMKTCPGCGEKYGTGELAAAKYVCPSCGQYISMTAYERVSQIADEGSFREFNKARTGYDPIGFPGYEKKIQKMRKDTGLKEAVVTGSCTIGGEKAVLCVMDKRFMMASMGTAVGEKVFLAFEYAVKKKLPIVIFTASGGARMQEGIMALMQMARTSAAVARHDEAGLLYIAVMTDPTTGGVTASFASLADITIAEKGALIGFAGQRVIEQTIGEELPEGFQRADFQLEKGFVDMVVGRPELKDTIARILFIHGRRRH